MSEHAIPKFAIAILLACGIAFSGAVLISAYAGASIWYYLLGVLTVAGALRHGRRALLVMLHAFGIDRGEYYRSEDYIRGIYVGLLIPIIVVGMAGIASVAIWGSHADLIWAAGVAVTAPIALMLLEPFLAVRYMHLRHRGQGRREDRRQRKADRSRTRRMGLHHGRHAEATAGEHEPGPADAP